jgi:prolyl 4-hydroxylase
MALLLDGGLSESVAAGKARFFRNGERFAQSEGLSIDLPAYNLKVENVVAHLSSLDNDLVPPLEIQSTRIYTARGKEVTLTNEMVEGDYFLLPPGQLWMWSPTDVGHKITFEVDDVASPIANKKLALESLSSSPKVFFIHNLVSDKEAADLIKHAEKRITASTVGSIDPQLDAGRTSQNTWDSTIPASKDIIQRVYSLLRIPYAEVTVDGLQIVQYSPGKFYNSHLDFLESDNATPENNLLPHLGGTNRYATVFFYLNDVPEGGQTAFTKGEHLSDEDLVRTLHRPARPSLTPLFLDSSLY